MRSRPWLESPTASMPTHANNALSHFKKQPLVEENHYRYHDEDVAVVVAKIALTHAPLAARAIPHLVSLLGRSQGARNSTTLDAIDKNRPLAHEAPTALAGAGNRWASETLSFEDPKDLDAGVADEALARLTTPLIHTDGIYSVGTNAIGDSLLVRHLSSDAIDTAITELLDEPTTHMSVRATGAST